MGRKKKVRGRVIKVPAGKPARVTPGYRRLHHYFGTRAPRGRTGIVWSLTEFLKERVPLVYVFCVEELRKSDQDRNPDLQRILQEWRKEAAPRKRPPARELTAYVIERAMAGAWEVWRTKPPYSEGDHDVFYRHYVHGHPEAIKDFRAVLCQPKPWPQHHVGHELSWFLGKAGEAARHYNFLKLKPTTRVPVLRIVEEN